VGTAPDLLGKPPQAREEAVHALDPLVDPVTAALRRAHEADVGASGVGPVALDVLAGAHRVALRLGHLRAVAGDHPLGEEVLERLLDVELADVAERLAEEARVEQVQNRVLHAADVLVDGHPVVDRVARPGTLGVVRVEVAEEVPGGIDERVHRVGLPARRAAALGAGRRDPVLGCGKRALPLRREVLDIGQLDG
jgi:hypothetical protein